MSVERRLPVVLSWHMHQPEYRDLSTGEFVLPWTYLHTIKDYADMAAHLERVPEGRAVVNFAPILLEQIADYAGQIDRHLQTGAEIRDPLLRTLTDRGIPEDDEARHALIDACLKVNEQRIVQRFEPFKRLTVMARWLREQPDTMIYADPQFFHDLVTWYHLGWLGETERAGDPALRALCEKGSRYSDADRRRLLESIGRIVGGVIERYRRLADSGQIELSMSPHAHPIVPLMLEIDSAREAMPEAPLPVCEVYPGGEQRARWHLERGMRVFERHFGRRPVGCWPSEGSVSAATLQLLESAGMRWAASGESVLRNSLAAGGEEADVYCRHRPHRLADGKLACFFRDDGLSDLIGFTYSDWHADDAVKNLLHHLDNIAQACGEHEDSVVSIILDGENAWEYYPENGYYFLDALYRGLAEHPGIELTTFSEYLDRNGAQAELHQLVAGSWVYGTFSTWIGEPDKNRGWDMLSDAKTAFDAAMDSGRLTGERLDAAIEQLAVCEGSDWFWWFGDYNDAGSVSDFERLYRRHLENLYRLLDVQPPDYLQQAFTFGSGSPEKGGTMRRGQEVA